MDRGGRVEIRTAHAPGTPGGETNRLLKTEEAARYVRLSPRTLERYRVTGEGPEYLKVGRRVFYRRMKLDEWLERKRRRSTSDPGPPDNG